MNYCYDALGGRDADFIGWEHSYTCGGSKDVFETIARIASWNKAVIYYSASGAALPSACGPSKHAVPYISEEWRPSPAATKVNISWDHIRQYRDLQNAWYADGNSVSRFTKSLGKRYKGVAPHGFNFWGKSSSLCRRTISKAEANHSRITVFAEKGDQVITKGCEAVHVLGTCHDDLKSNKTRLQWLTREAGLYGNTDLTGVRMNSQLGMHMLRGEILVYSYARILVDAIYTVMRDTAEEEGRSKEELIQDYKDELRQLQVPVPQRPLHCKPEECNQPPQCYTDYEPHYTSAKLSNIVLGEHEGWMLMKRAPPAGQDKFGYKDSRIYYKNTIVYKQIDFKVQNVRAGVVRLYGKTVAESIKHAMFFLLANVTSYGDYREKELRIVADTVQEITLQTPATANATSREVVVSVPQFNRASWPHVNFTVADDNFIQLNHVPLGNHILSVVAVDSNVASYLYDARRESLTPMPKIGTVVSHLVIF